MSSTLMARWSRSVSGWVKGEASNIQMVLGTGGAKDLEVATRFLTKLTTNEGAKAKWVTPWYQLKFDSAYAFYVWSLEDSAKAETTRQADR